jgi:aldose 1-epimerase
MYKEFLVNERNPIMLALRSGDLCLEIAPNIGGSIASFYLAQKHGRFDLMRPAPVKATTKPPALGTGMFPMVPYANCIRENRFTLDGMDYSVSPNMEGSRLNFHGSGWTLPWMVQNHSPSHAILALECSDSPYSFTATQEFHLSDNALKLTTSITNNAPVRMPFGMGQHPWFPRHGDAKVRFQSDSFLACDNDGLPMHREPSKSAYDFSESREPNRKYQNRCYENWDGLAEIYWPGADVCLAIRAEKMFQHLMFHEPANDPETFCLEPQTNAPCGFDTLNDIEIGPGIHLLKPDETLSGDIEFSISPIKIQSTS